MSRDIEHPIRTRGSELDREALIPPHVFLRYMEHLRWESAAQGSFDLAGLFADGCLLVVVGQKLRMFQQVGMGVDLTGTHRVCAVGRTSITIQNDFHRSGALVAQGLATAVFLDPSGEPAPLPEQIGNLAAGVSPPQNIAHRLNARPPAGAWRWRLQVRPSDLDLYRHTNQAMYLAYIEDARAMAVKAGAIPKEAGGRLQGVSIDYLKQTFLGDQLEACVWVLMDGTYGVELQRLGKRKKIPVCRARVDLAATPYAPSRPDVTLRGIG